MITLQALLEFLNSTFSFFDAKDNSYNGLQVEGKGQIHRVAFAVSASLEVIEKAKEADADALIVHHGLYWDKQEPPLAIGPLKKKLLGLLTNEISLIAYHLPLDAHTTLGNNWKAAQDLGAYHLKPFAKWEKLFIGVQGEIKALSLEEFVKKLESYYNHSAFVAKGDKKQIEKIAIVSGGAHKLIKEAADAQVDCFITGSFDEPIWDLAKELNVHFVALGHHATERVGIQALMEEMKKNLSIDALFIDVYNPF